MPFGFLPKSQEKNLKRIFANLIDLFFYTIYLQNEVDKSCENLYQYIYLSDMSNGAMEVFVPESGLRDYCGVGKLEPLSPERR